MKVRNKRGSVLLGGALVLGLAGAAAHADTVVSGVGGAELIDPLETVDVDMFVNHTGALYNLGAYQGATEVSGSDSGTLDVYDMAIDHNHPDWVFSSVPEEPILDCTEAVDAVCAVMTEPGPGIYVENPGYLGTLTYLASSDAQGVFDVDVDTSYGTGTMLQDNYNVSIPYLIDDPAEVGVGIECFSDSHCGGDPVLREPGLCRVHRAGSLRRQQRVHNRHLHRRGVRQRS